MAMPKKEDEEGVVFEGGGFRKIICYHIEHR